MKRKSIQLDPFLCLCVNYFLKIRFYTASVDKIAEEPYSNRSLIANTGYLTSVKVFVSIRLQILVLTTMARHKHALNGTIFWL